ncbi:MAG TPA: hypothetical protein VK348_12415, partial [Planctomycetota bacterium]|nr:hypothetical protein [Planctomycetota bacterium]
MTRVQGGNVQALEEFAQRLACVPRILASRNARLGRPLTAEELQDVAQDVFVVVLRRLGDFQPILPLESWMFGICNLLLRSAARAKARARHRTAELDQKPASTAPAPT